MQLGTPFEGPGHWIQKKEYKIPMKGLTELFLSYHSSEQEAV